MNYKYLEMSNENMPNFFKCVGYGQNTTKEKTQIYNFRYSNQI